MPAVLTPGDLRNLADALDQMTETRQNTDVQLDGMGMEPELTVRGDTVGQLVWDHDAEHYAIEVRRPA